MSEQKVRVHSENDKDFERGSKIMISTYLRMFWINNRAEDRKTLWVLQSLLQPTGVTVEQRNTKINLRHVRNLRLHIIHSYHSSMMSAWHCAACWPNKHINADTKKHITWKILSLISVQPFLWMGSVCVWSRWHAHGTHTHTQTQKPESSTVYLPAVSWHSFSLTDKIYIEIDALTVSLQALHTTFRLHSFS